MHLVVYLLNLYLRQKHYYSSSCDWKRWTVAERCSAVSSCKLDFSQVRVESVPSTPTEYVLLCYLYCANGFWYWKGRLWTYKFAFRFILEVLIRLDLHSFTNLELVHWLCKALISVAYHLSNYWGMRWVRFRSISFERIACGHPALEFKSVESVGSCYWLFSNEGTQMNDWEKSF